MDTSKRLVINSDDLGISKTLNDAVLNGYINGLLTQTSLLANGAFFDDALKRVIPACENMAIGVHLNTYEGESLTSCPELTDDRGYFNKSFVQTLLKSFDKNFLSQIEQEWDAQIAKIINSGIKPTHLDSHVHYHSIPNLFKIAQKLAEKYNIKYIRTQNEKFYLTKFNIKYIINIIKNILLNLFSYINKKNIKSLTNEYLIGVLYTSMMNSENVIAGLKVLPKKYFAEILIHPKCDETNNEYKLLFDEQLRFFIEKNNIILTNYNTEMFKQNSDAEIQNV